MQDFVLDVHFIRWQGADMHLRDFLRPAEGRPLSNADFARQIGRPESTVSRWVSGEVMPDPVGLLLLRQATNGVVTADDMLDGLKERAS